LALIRVVGGTEVIEITVSGSKIENQAFIYSNFAIDFYVFYVDFDTIHDLQYVVFV
jgi:hypothetical protein